MTSDGKYDTEDVLRRKDDACASQLPEKLSIVLFALALGGSRSVAAACGDDDGGGGEAQEGRHAQGPRHRRRRRQPRPRLLVLPVRLPGARPARPSASSTAGSRTRPSRRPTSPRTCPRSRTAARRHDQDQAGHQVQRRRSRTAPSRRRTSSTRSSAASCRRSATATRTSTTATSRASKAFTGRQGQGDLRASRRPTTTTLVIKTDQAGRRAHQRRRARHALHGAGAEGLRPEVRQGQAVDLRRAPGVHRPVHDRERRQGQRSPATSRARS